MKIISIIICINFLAAAALHLFLGIPKTLLTLISISLLMANVVISNVWTNKTLIYYSKHLKIDLIFLLAAVYLFAISSGASLIQTGLYLIFFLVPYSLYLNISSLTAENGKSILRILVAIGLIQLPVILFERLSYDPLVIAFTSKVRYEDTSIGTFYLGNDHAVGFFMIILIALIYKFDRINKIERMLLMGYFFLTIFFLHSIVSFLMIFLFIGLSYLERITVKKLFLPIIALGLLVIISTKSQGFLANTDSLVLGRIENSMKNLSMEDFEKFSQTSNTTRFQEVLAIVLSKPKIVGDGAYSYFSPFGDGFKLGSNYSQLLWFYHDLGIIGIIFFAVIIFALTRRINRKPDYKILIIFIFYSFFTNTFEDISFMFCYLFYQRFGGSFDKSLNA